MHVKVNICTRFSSSNIVVLSEKKIRCLLRIKGDKIDGLRHNDKEFKLIALFTMFFYMLRVSPLKEDPCKTNQEILSLLYMEHISQKICACLFLTL